MFCSTVLWLEAFVVFFATLVADGLRMAGPGTVWAVGGGAALVCVLAALSTRSRIGVVLGSLVQVALIASGALLPTMWFVGAVFAVLWVIALVLGDRIDTERAERSRAEAAAPRQ